MIREIIKISAGSASSDPLPSSPGHSLSGDRCEGPVRVVEGAERGNGKFRRLQHHPFPARDVRDSDVSTIFNMSPSQIVEALNRFCHQKPGGQFDPIFKSLPYCIICNEGGICFGPNCKGHERLVPKLTIRYPTESTNIPGLEGHHSTTLTIIEKTHTKHQPEKDFLPFKSIFKAPSHFFSGGTKTKSRRKRTARKTMKNISYCSTSVYDVQVLQKILWKKAPKTKKFKASLSNKPSSHLPCQEEAMTSSYRRLRVSEVPCQKKKKSSHVKSTGGNVYWRIKTTLSGINVERSEKKMVETGVKIPVIPAHGQTGNFISKGKIIIKAEDDNAIIVSVVKDFLAPQTDAQIDDVKTVCQVSEQDCLITLPATHVFHSKLYEDRFRDEVTSVKKQGVWVMFVDYSNETVVSEGFMLPKKFLKYVPAIAVSASAFSVGSSCLVRWMEDKVWCRARVDNFVKGMYEITFVDYGNKVTVVLEDMLHRVEDVPANQLEMAEPLVWKWFVGMTCVAKWSEDNMWYNGVVSGVGGGQYTVMFVDYGDIKVVREENIVESGRDIPADERENVDLCDIIEVDGNVATNYVIGVAHADPQALPENISDIKDMFDDSCATPQISQPVAELAAQSDSNQENEKLAAVVNRRSAVGSFCIAEWAEDGTWYNDLVTTPGIVRINSPYWIGWYDEVTGRIEAEDHSTTHFKADLGHALMSVEAAHAVFDLESYSSEERVTLQGGGGHGGKRDNTGRKCGKSNKDWKIYKKLGKKEAEKIKKTNKQIDSFFKKSSSNPSHPADNEDNNNNKDIVDDDLVSIEDMELENSKEPESNEKENMETKIDENSLVQLLNENKDIFKDNKLMYFQNGCFASREERKSESNYTCAIDSLISLGETILISGNFKSVAEKIDFCPLLKEIHSVLQWRLQNNYSWSHRLRNSTWDMLAAAFPQAFTPLGKVTATVEPPVLEIGRLWPVMVIVDAFCSECNHPLGQYSYQLEDPILLSSPKNGSLRNKNYTLSELFKNRLDKHVNTVLRHKVICNNGGCRGLARHGGIGVDNMKLPSFLFLNFILEGPSNTYCNDFKDSCILEEDMKIGHQNLELIHGLMSSQQHFFSICKVFNLFYKFDNMIRETKAVGYRSFKEAYMSKKRSGENYDSSFHLSGKSVKPRKGAVYFAVFKGEDIDDVMEENWSKMKENATNLNNLANLDFEKLFDDLNSNSQDFIQIPVGLKPGTENESSRVAASGDTCSKNNIKKDELENNDSDEELGDHFNSGASDEDSGDVSDYGGDLDDGDDEEDEAEDGEEDEAENNEGMADDVLDNVEMAENHSSKCTIDYRLQTFEDIGRYMRNNPGSFYDHSQNLWFCSVCQNFGSNSGSSRPWVDRGVKLGDTPGRIFKRHFTSKFHLQNVEMKKMFGSLRTEEKSNNILMLLKNFRNTEESKVAENREAIKILFRSCHYIIKQLMSNVTYTTLIKLITECGSETLKKFRIKSPRNATYLSMRTFDNIIKVLNKFTEEPLLKSLQAAKNVTLFHDETVDISNHQEAAVFAMYYHEGRHKEHFMGLMNMSAGQTAEKHYKATLQLCNQKGLKLENVAFADLDGCATNAGDMQGFKLYFLYHNPHFLIQICNSHTLALIPKHKITESRFRAISDADQLMISLFVLFKKSSIRMNVFENCQIVLEMKVLKLIAPSSTRWLTHEHCFRRIVELFEPTLVALSQIYHERGDVDALGVLVQLVDPSFVLSALMLADMLGVMRPLTLWLQTSPASADITELPSVVTYVVNKLKYLSGEDPAQKSNFSESEQANLKFNLDTFISKLDVIESAVESLPAASRLRNSSQTNEPQALFMHFKRSVQEPFVKEITSEIMSRIKLDPITAAFRCLDSRHFPKVKSELPKFGKQDIKILVNHYGEANEARHPKTLRNNRCDPKINKNETLEEFDIFKTTIFEINATRSADLKQQIYNLKKKLMTTLKINANKKKLENLKAEIEELESKVDKMSLAEAYNALSSPGRAFLFPNILVLMELANLCPIGNATVERLFSFLKLIKTKLRNQLGDFTLDCLLRVKIECKDDLEDKDLEQLVNMFREYLMEISKSGEIRIQI